MDDNTIVLLAFAENVAKDRRTSSAQRATIRDLIRCIKKQDSRRAELEAKQLSRKELLFLAELMEQGGKLISSQICEDMSPAAYNIFSPQEKDELERKYHDWNGDPEEFTPGFFMPNAGFWLEYYAAQFRSWASGVEKVSGGRDE